jgi:hypothetical protein
MTKAIVLTVHRFPLNHRGADRKNGKTLRKAPDGRVRPAHRDSVARVQPIPN